MDVKTLCLGVLSLGDASGYEIKQAFEDAFSYYMVAGFGSIYPALAELTAKGLVTCTELAQEKRPAKKVYHLTEAGRAVLMQRLEETHPRHKVRSEFLVLLTFAHLLGPEKVAEVLAKRVADIEAELEHINSCGEECDYQLPGMRFVVGYAQAVHRAAREYINNEGGQLLQALQDKNEDKGDA